MIVALLLTIAVAVIFIVLYSTTAHNLLVVSTKYNKLRENLAFFSNKDASKFMLCIAISAGRARLIYENVSNIKSIAGSWGCCDGIEFSQNGHTLKVAHDDLTWRTFLKPRRKEIA